MSPREGRALIHLLDDIEVAIAELRDAEAVLATSTVDPTMFRVAFNATIAAWSARRIAAGERRSLPADSPGIGAIWR